MKEVTMPDPIADFFAELAQGGAGPLLGDVTATVRFDVTYPGYVRIWRVAIDGDRIRVTGDWDGNYLRGECQVVHGQCQLTFQTTGIIYSAFISLSVH